MRFCSPIMIVGLCFVLSACTLGNENGQQPPQTHTNQSVNPPVHAQNLSPTSSLSIRDRMIAKYSGTVARQWGENVTGVNTRLNTNEKVIALTLDACGGPGGSDYDAELIYFLRQNNIPATLFVNSRWIDANYWRFVSLANNPLFEIENHGTLHKPLSINGKSAWGIRGTEDVGTIVDEVLHNHLKIQHITGKAPRYFRSGTAFYDEVGVRIVGELGERVVNYNVLGDAGATFSAEQVKNALLSSKPGSIVLLHMNKPTGGTAEGIRAAVPELIRRGYRFVKLTEFPLR